MTDAVVNSIYNKELYSQYRWISESYPPLVREAYDEFFLPGLSLILLGVSKNNNPLMDKDSYFVTKIMIDKNYDIFFRSSEKTISMILEKALGKPNSRFSLNKLSDLEAKIITTFNDYMYGCISEYIAPPPPTLKRTNFDVINLTFLVTSNKTASKFIITIPQELVKPEAVVSTGVKFKPEDFEDSCIDAKVTICKTKFKLMDIKNIELDDIVVFDNSSINSMILQYKDYEKEINLNPNKELVLPYDKNEGELNMDSSADLWDTIEVEMTAQFDKVKVSLGELKNIEKGLVVDLTSIYDNKVTLSVDEKPIAKGELVIVNDRYGVKVNEILSVVSGKPEMLQETAPQSETPVEQSQQQEQPQQAAPVQASEEDEFDYSDFELEDEDI